ncbi:hypothetical protein [Bosea massiliensis]|uniref:Uncharacterized protein n=1 Tax=Bosea massiliensis TaxID=151419 RepID=A0ABW0P8S4_9HYPH
MRAMIDERLGGVAAVGPYGAEGPLGSHDQDRIETSTTTAHP